MSKVKAIERLKWADRLLTVIFTVSFFVTLIFYLVEEFTCSNPYDIKFIIAVSLAAGNVVLTLASFIILFKIKQRFRVKYFGTVSAEDRKISENLIKRIHCVETANYPFLDDERYDISVKSLNNILNKLAKGNKVYKEWSKSCFNICELIDNSSDKDDSSNAKFNKFMWDLHDLLDRNITDI